MNAINFRDIEQLSAFLDSHLSVAETTRLESRLSTNQALAAALDELRQARSILRRTPHRRAPRNFSLTPRLAGIKPPLPRAVPAFSWASAAAVLLFVFTLGTNFLGGLSFGAAAPMMVSAPQNGVGGGPPPAEAPLVEMTSDSVYATATPEILASEANVAPEARGAEPPPQKRSGPINPWLVLWPSLALLLLGMALLVRWMSQQAFKRKMSKK